MIPRYKPALSLTHLARFRFASAASVAAAEAALSAALGLPADGERRVFGTARQALLCYFAHLAACQPRRTVLVSAQICPVVPAILRHLGFRPWFVDLDANHPGPGPDEYRAAARLPDIAADHAATLIAPFYGYLADGLEALAPAGSETLVLDLAQGFGLSGRLGPLAGRAGAIVYSFGLGKGIDTGGGLLSCRPGVPNGAGPAGGGLLPDPGVLVQAAALRTASALGLYRLLVPAIDRANAGQEEHFAAGGPDAGRRGGHIYGLWQTAVARLDHEIAVAQQRATVLFAQSAIATACRDGAVYSAASQAHLRQVLRLRDPTRRATILARLRGAGIDAMPAGEPLPPVGRPETAFPYAAAFCRDAIRLPFLGRLSPGAFARLQLALERTLADNL